MMDLQSMIDSEKFLEAIGVKLYKDKKLVMPDSKEMFSFKEMEIKYYTANFAELGKGTNKKFVDNFNGGAYALKWENSDLFDTIIIPRKHVIKRLSIKTSQDIIYEYTLLVMISDELGELGDKLYNKISNMDTSVTYNIEELSTSIQERDLRKHYLFGYVIPGVILLFGMTESSLVEQVCESYIRYELGIGLYKRTYLKLLNMHDLYKDEYAGT